MTLLTFLIIPLVAGYSFANSWHHSRYRITRSNGYNLYFSAALYGIAMLIMAALTLLYLISRDAGFVGYINSVAGFFHVYPNAEHYELRLGALLVITLLYGVLGGHFLNIFTGSQWPYKRAIKNADFERLVLRAMERSLPMLVTLENGKVYVGYAIRTIDPLAEVKELRILPVFSGYRSSETGEVSFNTNYSRVLREISEDGAGELGHLAAGDFEVVVPVTKIVTSTLYDSVAHKRFHEDERQFNYRF